MVQNDNMQEIKVEYTSKNIAVPTLANLHLHFRHRSIFFKQDYIAGAAWGKVKPQLVKAHGLTNNRVKCTNMLACMNQHQRTSTR